jgi:transposase
MLMAAVMIGVDPHKGSHTAVVAGLAEEPLGELRVRACAAQAGELVAWAAVWPERTWAVEGARGLGRLQAQQLVAAGERVLDVPPELACRVRLLQAGDTDKNDPDDALPVAIAALRSRACRPVTADDHPAVLTVRAERRRDLGRARNQVACRLHAVLRPGSRRPCEGDLRSSGRQDPGAGRTVRCRGPGSRRARRRVPGRPAPAWTPSCATPATSRPPRPGPPALPLTQVFGAGPVVAGTIIGDVTDVARFPGRDHFAAYNGTAPAGASSGNRKARRLSLRGNRRVNHAIHMAAITQIRHRHSDGRAYYEKKLAEGKTHKEALRSLKRRISDAIFARLQADALQAAEASVTGPGGQPGNDSASSAAGSHPARRLFGQATPGPDTTIRPGTTAGTPSGPRSSRTESRGRAGHSPVSATQPSAKRQAQVERPERSADERPGGTARRRPNPAGRKAPVGTTSKKNPTPT